MCLFTDKPDMAMVRCSRADCPLGTWFHVDCMDVTTIPDVTEDWWCSDECRQTRQSVLCYCKTVRSGDTVTCANGECCSGSVFHLQCVNMQSAPGIISKYLLFILYFFIIFKNYCYIYTCADVFVHR